MCVYYKMKTNREMYEGMLALVVWVTFKTVLMSPTRVPLVRLLLWAFPWIYRYTCTLDFDPYKRPTAVVLGPSRADLDC